MDILNRADLSEGTVADVIVNEQIRKDVRRITVNCLRHSGMCCNALVTGILVSSYTAGYDGCEYKYSRLDVQVLCFDKHEAYSRSNIALTA